MLGVSRKMTAIVVAVGMFGTAASVASSIPLTSLSPVQPSPPIQLSPIVALSIFGSQASVTALCGSAISAATAAAQTLPVVEPTTPVTGQPAVGGCVLPVTDTPPVALVGEAPPPGVAPFSIFPLLAGLAGIGGAAAAVASQGSGNDNNPPVSVN